jgi:TPR repeat protein
MRRRAVLVGIVSVAAVFELHAQPALPTAGALQPAPGAPAQCAALLETLNAHRAAPSAEDLHTIGRQFEAGDCLARDAPQAARFYAQAARLGSVPAAHRIAALFGAGRGVSQSYANAGAWLVGKGGTEEKLEPWDYSVGMAFTFVATALEQVSFPPTWPQGLELQLALAADTRQPGKLQWRFMGTPSAQDEALRQPLADAFGAAAGVASSRMAPAVAPYVVPVRVTLPITVRRSGATVFDVAEQDVILR